MNPVSVTSIDSEIDNLREMEVGLKKGLLAQQQKVMDLMNDRPDGFVLGKLRDIRIRKAIQALKEGQETMITLKVTLRHLEMELKIGLDRENEA